MSQHSTSRLAGRWTDRDMICFFLRRIAGFVCMALPFVMLPACEKPQTQADKRVEAILTRTSAVARGADITTEQKIAADKLDRQSAAAYRARVVAELLVQAAGEAEASAASKMATRSLIGQQHLDKAVSLVPALLVKEGRAATILDEIERLVARIAGENLAVTALKGLDPSGGSAPPLAAYQQAREKAAQDADAAQKLIDKLTADIQAKEAEIKELEAKKTQHAAAASELLARSEQTTGKESVDLYSKGVAERRESLRLANTLGIAQTDLSRLNKALNEAQELKKSADAAAARALSQIEKIQETWKNVQAMIAQRQASAKAALENAGVLAKADELANVLKEAQELRMNADKEFQAAATAFEEAARAANTLFGDLGVLLRDIAHQESPGRRAWSEISETCHPRVFRLMKARANYERGLLFAHHRTIIDNQQRLAAIMTAAFAAAGLTLPPDFARPTLGQESLALAKSARECFLEADTDLREIVEGDRNPSRRIEALTLRVGVLYGMYSLARDKASLDQARAALSELSREKGQGAPLPQFPEELESGIVSRAAAPPASPPPTPAPPASPPPTTQPDTSGPVEQPATPATPAAPQPAPTETPAAPANPPAGETPQPPQPPQGENQPATPPATPPPQGSNLHSPRSILRGILGSKQNDQPK